MTEQSTGGGDDFSRSVYCLLGVPVDDTAMPVVIDRMLMSSKSRNPFFFSTPNLNFVALSQRDPAFRASLMASDLCPIDGMGALILCKLLGLPITNRVAGSDIPAALAKRLESTPERSYKIAFFGGEPGVADAACNVLNQREPKQLRGVCAIDPGFLRPENMQDPDHVRRLNGCEADFLLVALGAQKGQAWIMANRPNLTIPAISHLGATVNFIAGTVKRAPALVQKTGFEWLWRIKEEPRLFNRYYQDGRLVLGLMINRVLPLAKWLRTGRKNFVGMGFDTSRIDGTIIVKGAACNGFVQPFIAACRSAPASDLTIDARQLDFFDLHFAGLLMMLEKKLTATGHRLRVANAKPQIIRALTLSGLGYLT